MAVLYAENLMLFRSADEEREREREIRVNEKIRKNTHPALIHPAIKELDTTISPQVHHTNAEVISSVLYC